MTRSITLDRLNELDRPSFVDHVGPVFESSPWIAERTWPARPFDTLVGLHDALCRTMHEAPEEQQLALIRAHPDLVGRAARDGMLTPESTREQAAAGLGDLSPEEAALFDRYNAAYRDKFGFPFVICARENRKKSILSAFPERLGHTRDQEMATALQEIGKIAWLRLSDLVRD